MSTLIWTHEEDSIVVLTRFIIKTTLKEATPETLEDSATELRIKADNLLEAKKVFEVVELLLSSYDSILSNSSEKDAEFFFTNICNYITKSENEIESQKISDFISEKLATDSLEKGTLRLKLLFLIYNLQTKSSSRFSVFLKILSVAKSNGLIESILPCIQKIHILTTEWGLIASEERQLFLSIYELLKDEKKYSKESFSFLLSYLETFEGEEDGKLNEIKNYSVFAIVEFIKSDVLFHSDLLDFAAIRFLEKDDEHSPLFSLLKIFLAFQLNDYIEFYDENSSVLKSLDISHEHCISKMRLLSLTSLAENSSNEISYSHIQETLQIQEDDVEKWVIKAINAKVLDARISQTRKVIIINKSTKRVFGAAQWMDLRSKISSWKENVSSMAKSFQNARVSGSVIPNLSQQALAY